MSHHRLDPYPIPKDKTPLFVNEPQLVDKNLFYYPELKPSVEPDDNIRIYVPIDLNKDAILQRLDRVIAHYGEANEDNEPEFRTDVDMLISQVEIYDQIWYVRRMPEEGDHSVEGISLVKEFVKMLEGIPDGCAECFPFEVIDELKKEFLYDRE